MILPATAIFFAVAAAFVTNATPKAMFANQPVSFLGGSCAINGYCTIATTGPNCQGPSGQQLDSFTAGNPAVCSEYSSQGAWTTTP